jgi:serine/threonine protein kinase
VRIAPCPRHVAAKLELELSAMPAPEVPSTDSGDHDREAELLRLWRQGDRPDVWLYLERCGALSLGAQVAVLAVDQEERWRRGERVPAESYLEKCPALLQEPEKALELIYGEFLLRQELGDKPRLEEFTRRFPAFTARLEQQIQLHGLLGSSPEQPTGPAVAGAGPASLMPTAENSVLSLAGDRADQTTVDHEDERPPLSGLPLSGLPRRIVRGAAIGPYRLLERLGRGTFGEVWLAERDSALTKTRLAVKLPLNASLNLAAVRQEADMWVRAANHPNVIPLFEANIYDGQIVIVSEYAPGGSLQKWLADRSETPSPADVVTRLAAAILQGLSHLHRQGILHRDLKPANILMQAGVPRLTDFGLARLVDGNIHGICGTPAYMAPEVLDGHGAEPADLWAVGVIMYQLLAGSLPFPERDYPTLRKAILTQDPPPLPGQVPPALQGVVARALEKTTDKRFASAQEMLQAVESAELASAFVKAPMRLTTHFAKFVGSNRFALFVTATNLAAAGDVEITHVWIEADPKIHVLQDKRPLPRRLKPSEVWETWVELSRLPPGLWGPDIHQRVRVRLSTGQVVNALPVEDTAIPDEGFVAGR